MNPLLLIAAGIFFFILRKPADLSPEAQAFVAGAVDGAAPAAPDGGAVYTGGSGASGTHGVSPLGGGDRVVTS